MEQFNFAKARILERSFCREHLNKRLRMIVALAALTLLVVGGSSVLKASARTKTLQLKKDQAQTRQRCDAIKGEMASVETLSRGLKWQQTLDADSDRWVSVLGSVLRCAPSDIWLDRVEAGEDSAIVVDGSSASYESLADFAANLRSRGIFGGVRMSGSQVTRVSGRQVVVFSLQLTMREAASKSAARVPELGRPL